MAVTSVTEIWQGATFEVGKKSRKASRLFRVECNLASDGPVVAGQSALLPQLWNPHPKDSWMKCEGPRLSRIVGPLVFEFECVYSCEWTSAGYQANPLNAPPELEMGWETSTEEVDRDADGKIMVNSVGEPLKTSIQINDQCYTVSRNESSRPAWEWNNVVNSDYALGAQPGQLRLRFNSRKISEGGSSYWRTSYQVVRRADGWLLRRPNMGYYHFELNSAGVPAIVLNTTDGEPAREPWLLQANGQRLVDGMPTVWLTFKIFKERAFAPLGLPNG